MPQNIDQYTQFYEENENIDLPPSFKFIRMEGDTYLYGYGYNGRELQYAKNESVGRYGWFVTKVALEECCN